MSKMRKMRKQKARALKQVKKLGATLETHYPQDAHRMVVISGHSVTITSYGSAKYHPQERTVYVKNPRTAIAALRAKAQERPGYAFFTLNQPPHTGQ